jgi:hypothetical protein
MINENELKEILAHILNSGEFHESKRHQDLLTYLAYESLKSDSIKETTIAHDVFGQGADFDPGKDTVVRSYVSTLRKKLEHYYLTSEDSYTYRLEIPKGHYRVRFIKEGYKSTPTANYTYVYYALIGFLLILVILQWIFRPDTNSAVEINPKAPNPVWTELLASKNRPTMIVFGDYVFLSDKKKAPDREVFLRDPGINSEEDFQIFLKDHPSMINEYSLLNFTYLRQSSYLGLADILPILWKSNNSIELKSASQLKWKDFETYNIVFIGPFKTLHILSTLLPITNIRYNVYPPILKIVNEGNDSALTFNLDKMRGGNYQKDYGAVLKLRGSNNNIILLLTGFGEAGVMNAVKTSIDPQFFSKIKNFTKSDLPDSSLYFVALTEIEGVDQTVFRSEIKYFKLLHRTYKNIK